MSKHTVLHFTHADYMYVSYAIYSRAFTAANPASKYIFLLVAFSLPIKPVKVTNKPTEAKQRVSMPRIS